METKTGAPTSLPFVIKFSRRVWFVMVVSILVFAAVAEISGHPSRRPTDSFFESITVLAILCVAGWAVLRRKYVGEGKRQLSRDPNDGRALKRWQTGQNISFVASEAIALMASTCVTQGSVFAM
jgi:hypothetical protein